VRIKICTKLSFGHE